MSGLNSIIILAIMGISGYILFEKEAILSGWVGGFGNVPLYILLILKMKIALFI